MPRDSAAADRPASYLVGTAAAFPLFFRDRTKPINQLPFSPSAKFPKSGSSCESRAKMLAFSVPPGYRRRRPPARPKLDPFTGIIDGILAEDEGRPRKQRHTSKRIFERLRDEHGYAGGITIVKDYVLARRLRQREVFVPLRHDPGHAQADFGEALAEIAGV